MSKEKTADIWMRKLSIHTWRRFTRVLMLDRSDLIDGEGPVESQLLPVTGCQLFVGQFPENGPHLLGQTAVVAWDAATPWSFPPSSSRRSQFPNFLVGIRDLLRVSWPHFEMSSSLLSESWLNVWWNETWMKILKLNESERNEKKWDTGLNKSSTYFVNLPGSDNPVLRFWWSCRRWPWNCPSPRCKVAFGRSAKRRGMKLRFNFVIASLYRRPTPATTPIVLTARQRRRIRVKLSTNR